MAKSRYVYVQGKVKWFRHVTPDIEYRKWKHVMYPNPDSLEKVRQLQSEGLKNTLKKENDDEGYYVTWSRPTEKMVRGRLVGFAPPEVFMADGTTPLRNTNVGNGSDVTTKLEVYQHGTPGGGKAVAARWVSSRIDNLVPFEGNRDFNEQEAKASEGLPEQPAQF